MRRTLAIACLVAVLSGTTSALAALPPPPYRLGGGWEGRFVCAGPWPIWLMMSGC